MYVALTTRVTFVECTSEHNKDFISIYYADRVIVFTKDTVEVEFESKCLICANSGRR
jgi:hypothetical protein